MPQNDFLVWAGGLNANVLTQGNYAGLGNLTSGVVSGKASGQQANKTWRQTSIMSAMLAKFIVDRVNQPVIDDGTIQTIETNFISAILSLFVIPNTGVVPGTYGPTVSITVQADGRVTSLSNTGLGNTGVTAGTYTAPTITIQADGRISNAVSAFYGLLGGANQWTAANNFAAGSVGFTLDAKGSANGANLTFVGNGGTTPSKYIRTRSGIMEWLNSAYGAVIATLSDVGNFAVSGSLTAGTTVSSVGNINAGARLRATLGAFGSGDSAAAALLGDWNFNDIGVDSGWQRQPDGHIIQFINVNAPQGGGLQTTVYNLPVAYPNTFTAAIISLRGTTPGAGGFLGSISVEPSNLSQFAVTTNYTGGTSAGCIIWTWGK